MSTLETGVRCLNCHYLLANLTEHRCPECGRRFDPANDETFESEEQSASDIKRKNYRWIMLGLLAVTAVLWLVTWAFVIEPLAFVAAAILIGVIVLAVHLLRTAPMRS